MTIALKLSLLISLTDCTNVTEFWKITHMVAPETLEFLSLVLYGTVNSRNNF